MNKAVKGALAGGAAVALLLGGAGTLAYWTADDTVAADDITTGKLTLANGECTDWEYAAGKAGAGTTVVKAVPGDVVTSTCSYAVDAEGDNLVAGIDVSEVADLSTAGGGTVTATVDATYTVDGATATTVTENDESVVVTLVVTLPYGSANDPFGTTDGSAVNGNASQVSTAALDSITLRLTQQNPNPA